MPSPTDFSNPNRPTHTPILMLPDVSRRSRSPTLNRFRGKNTTPSLRQSWCADGPKQLFVLIPSLSVHHGKVRRSRPSAKCRSWRLRRLEVHPDGEGRMDGWWWTLSAKTRLPQGMGPLWVPEGFLRQQRQGGRPCCVNQAHNDTAAQPGDDMTGMQPARCRPHRPDHPPPLSPSQAPAAAQSHLGV